MMRSTVLLLGVSLVGCGTSQPTPPVVQVVQADPAPGGQAATPPDARPDPPPPGPATPATPAEATPFRFPEGEWGQRLEGLLTPGKPASLAVTPRSEPLPRTLPEAIANPGFQRELMNLPIPRMPVAPLSGVKPDPLPERAPVELGGVVRQFPVQADWPEAPRTRVEPPPELLGPAPLPILARPVTDRAPLEDPTVDFTAKTVILESIPLRSEPAGFLKLAVPDPFENREALGVVSPLPVTPQSVPAVIVVPRPPVK